MEKFSKHQECKTVSRESGSHFVCSKWKASPVGIQYMVHFMFKKKKKKFFFSYFVGMSKIKLFRIPVWGEGRSDLSK